MNPVFVSIVDRESKLARTVVTFPKLVDGKTMLVGRQRRSIIEEHGLPEIVRYRVHEIDRQHRRRKRKVVGADNSLEGLPTKPEFNVRRPARPRLRGIAI